METLSIGEDFLLQIPIPPKYFLALLGITVSVVVFNTSEFMPIGLLIDMSASFGKTEADMGRIVTIYAWAVAILSLPLTILAMKLEVRRMLLLTVGIFAAGQFGAAFATSYELLVAARLLVATAHAVFWSVAAPLATRLVVREHRPFALSMVVVGSSIAMVAGIPFGRFIGLLFGWRETFLVIGAIALAVLVYLFFLFPKLYETKPFSLKELPALLRRPSILAIYAIVVLFATSYFVTYSYIEPFLRFVAGFAPETITLTLMLVGASGLLGSTIFSFGYARSRMKTIGGAMLSIALLFGLWQAGTLLGFFFVLLPILAGIASIVFNVAFQAELIRAVSLGAAPVAMSIFSGIFNVGIGGGTAIGSLVASLDALPYIGYTAAAFVLLALLIFYFIYRPAIQKEEASR